MKIVHRDLREGKIKLRVESLDDLWYLKSILEEGDLVEGFSYRRVRDEEKKRADSGERVKMRLVLKVEGVEFSSYASMLRVNGTIEEGPEDLVSFGSHHTLEVKKGSAITITKGWKKWHLERLKEAQKGGEEPLVLIVGVEEGEAEMGVVRRYGVDFKAHIKGATSGKRFAEGQESREKEFNTQVAQKVAQIAAKENLEAIIVAGPGFWKENLLKALREYSLSVPVTPENTGSGGRAGVYEVLKRGVVERIVEECRIARESQLVERVMEEISKDGKVAYGIEEVERALDFGAAETLLLTENFLRSYEGSDSMIERAKSIKAEVVILSNEHEAGERLEGIGRVAALLRFPIS